MVHIETQEYLAYLVRLEDGFHVIDNDGTVGPVCNKRTSDGYIILSPNASNRKCYNEKNANKFFDENPDGKIGFVYKATRTNTGVTHIPNEKLISYLPQDLQDEYRAIIDRAIAARNDSKSKPLTDLEKARKKVEQAKAKLEALQAQLAAASIED